MADHRESIFIARPVDRVFAYMNDIEREPEWQPHLVEAEQIPPGSVEPGTRRRYVSEFLGKRIENTYVLTAYEPDRRVTCETAPGSALDAETDIRWEPVEGGTRVTMTMRGRARGSLRLVPPPVLEAAFRKELRGALARLKELLERDG